MAVIGVYCERALVALCLLLDFPGEASRGKHPCAGDIEVDRGILELQMDGEDMYNQFRKSRWVAAQGEAGAVSGSVDCGECKEAAKRCSCEAWSVRVQTGRGRSRT